MKTQDSIFVGMNQNGFVVSLVMVGLLLSGTNLHAQLLTDNLEGYWKFDGNPNEAIDSSGNGRDLTLENGASTGGTGFFRTSLQLDGLDDYAIRSDDDEAFDITNAFTVQAWVNYINVDGEQQLITKRAGNGWSVNKLASGPAHVLEANAIPNGIGAAEPGGSARSGDRVTAGVWTHVVFRLDGNTPTVFVNNEDNTDRTPCPENVPCGSWTFSAAHNTDQPLILGGATDGIDFYSTTYGDMDEVAIWSRALSDQEISDLYNNGIGLEIGGSRGPDVDFTWNTGAGNWNASANWFPRGTPGDGQSSLRTHETVLFGDAISATSTVFTDAQVTMNGVRFDNTASYVIAGGGGVNMIASTAGPLPTIRVDSGSHQFQAAVNLLNNTTVDVASGSTLLFNNVLSLNNNTLTKTGAGEMAVNNILASGGGTLNCSQGLCSGAGTIGGDLNNDGGIVSPGNRAILADGNVSVVPEPSTLLLLLLAGGCALAVQSRQRTTC